MKQNINKRVRPFNIVFYGSALELDKILLCNSSRIAHYSYAYHDCDTYEEDVLNEDGTIKHAKGELKVPHFHVNVDFFDAHTFKAVCKMFTTATDNPRVEPITDRLAMYEYLVHKNHPAKYQYPKSIIVCDSVDWWENLKRQGDFKKDSDYIANNIIDDMLCGVSVEILRRRYGRDFIIHYNQYKEFAEMCRFAIAEEKRKRINND